MDLRQRLTADEVWTYVCSLSEKIMSDFEKASHGEELNYESRLNLQKIIKFHNEMQMITDDLSDYETASNWFRLSRIARNEDTVDEVSYENCMIQFSEMFYSFKLLIPRYMLKSTTNRLSDKLNKSNQSVEENFFEDESDNDEDEVA